MTAQEFIEFYISEIEPRGREFVEKRLMAVPCDCGEPYCKGWQMVAKVTDTPLTPS